MIKRGANQVFEPDDDVAVLLDAHQDAFDTLELSCYDADGATCLALQFLDVDELQAVLIARDDIHELTHVSLRNPDRLTPGAVVIEIAAVGEVL